MERFELSASLFAAAAMAACATPVAQIDPNTGEEYVCYSQKRTGSNFPRKVCRYTGTYSADREEDQETLERMRNEEEIRGRSGQIETRPDQR